MHRQSHSAIEKLLSKFKPLDAFFESEEMPGFIDNIELLSTRLRSRQDQLVLHHLYQYQKPLALP